MSDPRYDVKTSANGSWGAMSGGKYNTTIRDNHTGKEYHSNGNTPESSRNNTFKKSRRG